MQRESEGEAAKVEMMEANENLIEEMAAEERKVVEECRAEIGQKVRWADLWRIEMEKERAERDQAEERRDRWNIKEELEEAEARRQGEAGLSTADREEVCQEREWDRVERTETDGEEEGEETEWDPWRHVYVWVPSVNVSFASEAEKIDSARKAFEPRGCDEVTSNVHRHEANVAGSNGRGATRSRRRGATRSRRR